MTYVIAVPCVDVKDKACIDECPVDCIYEGRTLALHPPRRVRRLRCVRARVPGRGHLLRGRHPGEWAQFYTANVEFFDDLGSPGGAAKMGLIDKDHPIVAALPPQGE